MDFFAKRFEIKLTDIKTVSSITDQEELPVEPPASDDLEIECVHSERVVAKKALHNRSRWNRCVALGIGMTVLVGIIVGGIALNDSLRMQRSSAIANVGELLLAESEVALHDSPEDCWMILHGAVYDLTAYAPRHPTGPEYIWDYCGLDGTVAYDRFHRTTVFLDVVASQQMGVVASAVAIAETEDSEDELAVALSDPAPGSCWNLSHLARHNTPEDCYYMLYGSVYDFTNYLSRHPGGDSIMIPECGTEATAAYEAARRHTFQLLQRRGGPNYLVAEACANLEPEAGVYGVLSFDDSIPDICRALSAIDSTAVAASSPDPPAGACWNLEQVAQHNTPDDCYYILYGAVYDFTAYLDRHPGGDSIMIPECGTEATAAYEDARSHTLELLQNRGGPEYLVAPFCS